MNPRVKQESDCKEEMRSQASSPERFVDECLADDPVGEECENSAHDFLDLCLSQAAREVSRPLARDSGSNPGEDDGNKDTVGSEKAATTLNSLEQSASAEEPLGENSSLIHLFKPVKSEAGLESAGRVEKNDDSQADEELLKDLVSEKAIDLVGLGPCLKSPHSGTQQAGHLVDQTTLAFESLLPDVQSQHGIGDWKKEEPFCSPSLCNHEVQGFKMLHPVEARHQDERDCTPCLLPRSVGNVQFNDNPNGGKSRVPSHETVEFEEPSLNQHGMHRRCLLFDDAEAHKKSSGSHNSSLNPARIVSDSRLPAAPIHSEALSSSCIAESNTHFDNKHVVNFSKKALARLSICPYRTSETDKYVHDSSNPPVTVPMPSGIGLHLNSLGDSVAMGCGEDSLSMVTKNFSKGMRSCSVSVDVVVNVSVQATTNSASPLDISAVESTEIDHQENEASGIGYSSANFDSMPLNVKPLNSSLQSTLTERYLRPCEKKRPVLQDASGFEEHHQMSPNKKRRDPPNTTDNEGCKRCNCKKSKCLKLYCECFAAGVYCIEPCTCLVCFNKPEHEDIVLATRQQIESRNPLAFAPRIVGRVNESPSNSGEDDNQTPASARHKRGCNCKKSKCLKKYCECYQAGVGCSGGCRCEGCKNIFGKKAGVAGEEVLESQNFKGTEASPEGASKGLGTGAPMAPKQNVGEEYVGVGVRPKGPRPEQGLIAPPLPAEQVQAKKRVERHQPERTPEQPQEIVLEEHMIETNPKAAQVATTERMWIKVENTSISKAQPSMNFKPTILSPSPTMIHNSLSSISRGISKGMVDTRLVAAKACLALLKDYLKQRLTSRGSIRPSVKDRIRYTLETLEVLRAPTAPLKVFVKDMCTLFELQEKVTETTSRAAVFKMREDFLHSLQERLGEFQDADETGTRTIDATITARTALISQASTLESQIAYLQRQLAKTRENITAIDERTKVLQEEAANRTKEKKKIESELEVVLSQANIEEETRVLYEANQAGHDRLLQECIDNFLALQWMEADE